MKAKLVSLSIAALFAVLLFTAITPAVSAQEVVVQASILPTYSISVTNTLPANWVLVRGPNVLAPGVIQLHTSSDIPIRVHMAGSDDGHMRSVNGLLTNKMYITGPEINAPIGSGYLIMSINGVVDTPLGLSQTVQGYGAGDPPGAYTETLTFTAEIA